MDLQAAFIFQHAMGLISGGFLYDSYMDTIVYYCIINVTTATEMNHIQ